MKAMESSNLLDLIPQRSPIVMIDKFLGIDAEGISSAGLCIQEDNIFLEDDYLSDCGLIEHQAQTAAARMGYLCKVEGREVPLGFIGSVKGFQAKRLPRLGEEIISYVQIAYEMLPITLVEIKTYVGKELIAESQMKIFLQDA